MGTTLSNGVYLPDEGERNCYAGLKVNWEILNQKVADIVALQLAIAGALHREIVESLPTTDIDPNTIYMILSGTSATENVYNEFMYVNNAWELIGTSATDLTNYYTKAEVDGKLLLKASASDLTSHTGDTAIHVTASDKTKWTNSANTHVLRLALSALTPSTSDNSFSNLDDSTALKVGDKVMDTAGVLFEVTAIDTQNSTFTIGTALIDLAQDSDVVHKSGAETIAGDKTFNGNTNCVGELNQTTSFKMTADTGFVTGSKNNSIYDQNGFQCANDQIIYNNSKNIRRAWTVNNNSSGTSVSAGFNFILSASGQKVFYPISDSDVDNGSSSAYWKSTYTKKINTLEPSSLSLPSDRSARIDISSYFTATSNGAVNKYTVPANGYVYLNVADVVSMHLFSQTSNNLTHYGDTKARGSVGQLNALLPVRKDDVFACQWYTTATNVTLTNAFFIPCQGNV